MSEHLFEDADNNDSEKFYASLKAKLEENHNFPEDYLYKFIFPNENLKLTELYQIFDKIRKVRRGDFIPVWELPWKQYCHR